MASSCASTGSAPCGSTPVTVPAPREPRLDALASDERPGTTAARAAPAATVRDADLLPVQLAHRLARRDTRRLAAVAEGLASGTTRFTEKRALAFGEWVERVCSEIAGHHDAEGEVVWPLLEHHAGTAVDLSELADDHVALHALLNTARRGARSVVAALVLRPSAVATAQDFARMRGLARALGELAELVEEHVAETERVVLAVLTAHVPRVAWLEALGDPRTRHDAVRAVEARLRGVATAGETATLRAHHGGLHELRVRLAGARLARRERLVYGAEGAAETSSRTDGAEGRD